MKRLLILFTLCLTFLASQSFAQEICNNNLDDDNDGLVDCRDGNCPGKVCEICNNGLDDDGDLFIDCYDKECNIDAACKDFFLGKDAVCQVKPDSFPPFEMKLKYRSDPGLANHINRLLVGDVDNDGIPELVTTYRNANIAATIAAVNILQAPATGNILTVDRSINTIPDGFQPTFEDIAMADINKDGCAELFILTSVSDGNTYRIIAYDCNGVKIWTNPIVYPTYPGTMGLADFDGDGAVELYTRTQIFDAHSGTLMGQNNIGGGNANWGRNSNATIAVDILSAHAGLELVAGCRIYSVAINRPALPPAIPPSTSVLNLVSQRPEYFTRTGRTTGSGTSVADFNQDGFLDILAVGSDGGYDLNTTIFFWDVQNNGLKKFSDPMGVGDYSTGWKNGAGRINIADIDGDTLMNAVYVSGRYLYALEEGATNLQLTWRQNVTEETSGYTGCTMFDFNADGKSEIVYRDEDYIYIYTTEEDGTVIRSTPVRCSSRTSNEYPIVANMDGDIATEICVVCSTTNTINGKNLGLWDEAEVRVYESANEPWVPARKVWNQHGYFVANVNDDLTIPKKQQLHHLVYSKNAECRKFGTSRPLNSFLNQSPYLNSFGCPSFPAPNLAVLPFNGTSTIDYSPPTCPVDSFEISFKFMNRGDIGISGNLNISFYNGDPRLTTLPLATRLTTKVFPLAELNPGDTVSITTIVKGPGSQFKLFIVLNDNGTTIPLDFTKQPDRIAECEYDNVIEADIIPLPAPLIPELIRDNLKCLAGIPGAPSPADNGAVRAYVPIGAIKDSVNFDFYWSDGAVAKPMASADYDDGPTYSGLAAGTYTVYAVHKVVSCGSDTVRIIVGEIPKTISAKVTVIHQYDNCKNPNGELKVDVDTNGDGIGETPSDFTYIWYDGPDILVGDTLGISNTLTVLSPGSYSVLVFDKATGCPANDSEDILDATIKPAIDTTHVDIDCSNLPTGVASASIQTNITAGYTFYWSNGSFAKPTEDFKGPNYTARPAGFYTVVAEDNSSKCKSDTVTVEVKRTLPTLPSATKTSNQVSCDSSQPSGSAFALVNGDTTGYRFDWYIGQNTIDPPAYLNSNSVTGLPAGIYTVKATDRATNCFGTDTVNILSRVVVPTITASGTPMTKCQPLDGSVIAIPNSGAIADYTFTWYNGNFVKAVTDYPLITGNTLSGVAFGTYTVKAFNNVTHCDAIADTALVKNLTPTINITVIPNPAKYPRDCTSFEGEISATISSTGNSAGFIVDWYKGVQPALDSLLKSTTFAVNPVADALLKRNSGFYTIKVVNQDDNCKAFKEYFLPSKSSDSLSVSGLDLTQCTPINGEITATLIIKPFDPTTNPVVSTNNDYIFQLFKYNTAVPQASINGSTNAPADHDFTFTSLDSGRYYVKGAAAPGSTACEIFSEVIELEYNPIQPTLSLSGIADMNCVAAAPAGQVVALVTGPAALNYEFFSGIDNTIVADRLQNGSTSTLTGQPSGFYTTRVTAGNGCFNIKSVFVPADSAFLIADIGALPRTMCDPSDIDGQIIINTITEVTSTTSSTGPFNPVTYSVTWPIPDPNLATPAILEDLDSGNYLIQVTNITTGCKTPLTIKRVEDMRAYPTINLVSFVNPTRCLKPVNLNGELHVQAVGSSTSGFTFNWTGPVAQPNTPDLIGLTVLPGQSTITYAIEVINNDTQCPALDTYILQQDTALIFMNASSSPLTFCSSPDGATYAIVTSADETLYSYEWYAGTSAVPPVASPPPILPTGRLLPNLSDGVYLIVATDLADATCFATDTVTVEDLRVLPVVTAMALSPLTNCDDTNPNGIASASVGGNVIDYRFDWFREPITTDTLGTGSQISDLADSTYNVIASNIVTGCSNTAQVSLDFVPTGVVSPTIDIISHVTSCIEDNGVLSVSVDGNTMDYIFEWYIGLVEKPTPDFVGDYLDSLAIGVYSVKATSKITGCVSPLVSEEILDQPIYPEFKIDVLPSPCDEEGGEIYLTITNGVEIDSIIWEGPNGQIIGDPVLQGIPAGHYTVTIISQLGCPASQEVDVKSEIHPFNGISRNGDGKNEYFHINCIEDFEDNVVRIFNRAGTMVYEEHGYDNIDIYFDGRSNKGVSMMGTNLPDGTYFYVIDKRDGSKPLAGYLEIVN